MLTKLKDLLLDIKLFIDAVQTVYSRSKGLRTLERCINKGLDKYRTLIDQESNIKISTAFYEALNEDDSVPDINTEWVYRYPVLTLNKGIRLPRHALEDGWFKDNERVLEDLGDQLGSRLAQYVVVNKEEGYTFALRENLTVNTYIDQREQQIVASVHYRIAKIPAKGTPNGDVKPIKQELGNLNKLEGSILNLDSLVIQDATDFVPKL